MKVLVCIDKMTYHKEIMKYAKNCISNMKH